MACREADANPEAQNQKMLEQTNDIGSHPVLSQQTSMRMTRNNGGKGIIDQNQHELGFTAEEVSRSHYEHERIAAWHGEVNHHLQFGDLQCVLTCRTVRDALL